MLKIAFVYGIILSGENIPIKIKFKGVKIMKKGLIIGIVAVVAVAAIVCGVIFLGGAPKVEVADSADALNKVLSTFAEEEKIPGAGGSDFVENEAALYSLEDKEAAGFSLYLSEDMFAQIDEAASYMHMLQNNFTGAAYHLVDASTAEAFAEAVKTNVLATRWMCGQPDTFVMYSINGGEYVMFAYGSADNITNFSEKVATVYGDAAVELANEAVVVA